MVSANPLSEFLPRGVSRGISETVFADTLSVFSAPEPYHALSVVCLSISNFSQFSTFHQKLLERIRRNLKRSKYSMSYQVFVFQVLLTETFLARLHFSAEELLLYPRRPRRRPRQRRRPHAK